LSVFLHRAGKTLADYHLPTPSVDFSDLNGVPRIVAEEQNYDIAELNERWEQGYLQANPEQKEILDQVVSAVRPDGNGGLFFIDGPGGTGKTFVENLILAKVRSSGGVALSVASSGIAAILLDGGRTSHSRFKIPIDIDSESLCPIPAQSHLAALLKTTSLIIWDEAPAQHRHCFQAVDRTLRDLRNDPRWFGGITVVFAGTAAPSTLIVHLANFACRRLPAMLARRPKGYTSPDRCFNDHVCSILEGCQSHAADRKHASACAGGQYDPRGTDTCDRICGMATGSG